MTEQGPAPIPPPPASFAALKNIISMMQLVQRLQDRGPHLPGIGVLYGFSGFGKTYSAIYASNKSGAIRVEVGDSWTKKTLLRAILKELGTLNPKGTVADLAEQAIERLAEPGHPPLIVDEADRLCDKGMIEIIREIHESAQVPVILIGEEALPHKLEASERTHNRVLEWVAAQPCDLEDTRKLCAMFAPRIQLSEDMIELVRRQSEGKARKIVTNIDRLVKWSVETGEERINSENYGGGFQPAGAPARRIVRRAA